SPFPSGQANCSVHGRARRLEVSLPVPYDLVEHREGTDIGCRLSTGTTATLKLPDPVSAARHLGDQAGQPLRDCQDRWPRPPASSRSRGQPTAWPAPRPTSAAFGGVGLHLLCGGQTVVSSCNAFDRTRGSTGAHRSFCPDRWPVANSGFCCCE